jgi:hypothetical protein
VIAIALQRPVEAGYFDDDESGREAFVRAQIHERIAARRPIFPARGLGLEFAALNHGDVRDVPCAAVAIANLRAGDQFTLGRDRYTVVKMGKRMECVIDGPDGRRRFVVGTGTANWTQFERDVEGLLVAAAHGVDAGSLLDAWRRDPVASE